MTYGLNGMGPFVGGALYTDTVCALTWNEVAAKFPPEAVLSAAWIAGPSLIQAKYSRHNHAPPVVFVTVTRYSQEAAVALVVEILT